MGFSPFLLLCSYFGQGSTAYTGKGKKNAKIKRQLSSKQLHKTVLIG
jgi:hypothetical protein